MKTRTAGFSLIWALILSTLLVTLAFNLIRSAQTINRSSRAVTQDALNSIAERNALTYAQRLLEVTAPHLLSTLPTNASAAELALQMQNLMNNYCDRLPDGTTNFRVYFTSAACGVSLSGTLPNATDSTAGPTRQITLPFVLSVQQGDLITSRKGTLTAQSGAVPASTYALLSAGDLTLGNRVQVVGDVQVDGHLGITEQADVTGVLSNSNCGLVTAGCSGARSIDLGSQSTDVMALTPTSARPSILTGGILSSGQQAETPSMHAPALTPYTVSADTLILGVYGDGTQYFQACLEGACTNYGVDGSGNLYRDNYDQPPVASAWNGALEVDAPGTLTIRPYNPDAASVARPLSVTTNQPVIIDGNVTYQQTSCAGQLCQNNGSNVTFSLQAPSVEVSGYTVRLHGAVQTGSFRNDSPLSVYGSVIGTLAGTGSLMIQGDSRAQEGLAAPLVPVLNNQWRKVNVDVQQ